MQCITVGDEQYREVARLAGISDFELAPVEDTEFALKRLEVDSILEKALRIGLRELRQKKLLAEDDQGIEGYTKAALAALNGTRPVACDTCDQVTGAPVLRLAGEVLEAACDQCSAALRA